ncbi:efflux transporter outer membrane subunit [Sphingomonas donggukensis]|uniref:Efflux transporter outer membrane subunit n=1 Tax=Sphingomonas donggukensis TaxID=2949093 RepID=A0ABY4TXL0_9SPHN|nr:efflux transporter outer membrane subunit [Sphingomonas donggukensis]URW76396.1 efflux transporter outer membrane subunit [Sphingomonas donggukensis]
MRKFAILAGTAALAGCNLAPTYRPPVAPIAPTFPDATTGARAAADIGWREFFGDARLQALIAAALANNRDLAQSVARVAQARAQYRIQDGARLPQIDVQAGASRTRTPLNSLAFPSSGTGTGDTDSPTSFTLNQFSLGVAVTSFELDFWGRVRNLSEAARREYLATVEAERAFRLSLVGQVAATYLQIRAGEEQIALAERTVTGRREGLRIARKRMDAGVTSTVDFDQAALLVTQAETELAELRRTTAQAENLLTVLVGGPIATTLPAPRPLSDPAIYANVEPGLPSALLVNRPDILQAEQRLRAANANIGAARAAFLPTISLTGLLGFISPALGSLISGDSLQYRGAVDINQPVLTWGRGAAGLRLTKAQRDELVAAYQRAAQEGFREVADALVARRRYAEQIAAQGRAVDAQRRLTRVARLRYDNGLSIYLEVLDAERNLFTAEQQLLTLRSAQLQSEVSLYIALGGGLKETAAG